MQMFKTALRLLEHCFDGILWELVEAQGSSQQLVSAILIGVGVPFSAFDPVHISRTLTSVENASSLEGFVQGRETLLFLCAGKGRQANEERDEAEASGSMHCELGL